MQSNGIESAADIEYRSIIRLPKFGPKITQNLVNWRTSVEAKFVYRASAQLDPRDQQTIDHEINQEGKRLVSELKNGPAELRQISSRLEQQRSLIRPELERALLRKAQTEANLRVFS